MFRIGQPVDRREVAATVAVTLAVMVVSFVTVWNSHAAEVAERESLRPPYIPGRPPGDGMHRAGHPPPWGGEGPSFHPFGGDGPHGPGGPPPPGMPPFGGSPHIDFKDFKQRPDSAAPTVQLHPISLTDVMESGVPTGDPPEPGETVL